MHIIDAHHHLWDLRALRYALFEDLPHNSRLARSCRAPEFDALARANGVVAAIAVEAASAGADPVRETAWLFEEVARSAVTRRVVAYAPVEDPGVEPYLRDLQARHPALAGIRRSFERVAAGFACSPAVLRGARTVARLGLPFDLVLYEDRLADVVQLAELVPEATFVLDHLGKPRLAPRPHPDWRTSLAALGRLPNVYAKVSGLITEAPGGRWDADLLRPYLDHAVLCFGWDRLMFGSDWPICDLAGGYARWLDVCHALADDASERERRAFFGGTAARIYRCEAPSAPSCEAATD